MSLATFLFILVTLAVAWVWVMLDDGGDIIP